MTSTREDIWRFSIGGLVAALLIFGCDANGIAQNYPSTGQLRVLFVGNSLTYYSNLPEIIKQLAKSAKQNKLVFKMIAQPNFSLEDHLNKGNVQKLTSRGNGIS